MGFVEQLALHFFPLPYVFEGRRYEGVSVPWASQCSRCDRQCESASESGLRLCSYGVNYQRVDETLLVAGIVVLDYGQTSAARKKALRSAGANAISLADLAACIERARVSTHELESELRGRKDSIISEYRESREYQAEIVEQLRPDIERALAQVHDYKQFVQQIIQNVNVIIETRCPNEELEIQLERASHEEQAIYWAARLMEEKLDAALFFMYPDRIHEPRDRSRFRLHGVVTKYRKIYQRRVDAKRLRFVQTGESRGLVEGNYRALPIIPHTLIDNAIKYAPPQTDIVLNFSEDDEEIVLTVGSFGPVIQPAERERIFDVFFRASEAAKRDAEGTGFGLASAQNVANAIGTEIRVKQETQPGPQNTRWTEFSVRFARAP